MSVPVEIGDDAANDIHQAARYFEAKRAGLGGVFAREVAATIDRIAFTPEGFAEVYPDARALELRRFGYVVYYRTDGSAVEVFAVMHGRRPPEAWRDRA